MPSYTPDWSEPGRSEDLLAAAGRHLEAIAREAAGPGDVLILRMRDGGVAKHVGILARSPEGDADADPCLFGAWGGGSRR